MRKRKILKINIEKIPFEKQRYSTEGDYWIDRDGVMQVRISTPGEGYKEDLFYTYLIHELTEAFLARKRGIAWEDIDKFDIDSGLEDPGASEEAPYHAEHEAANKIENILKEELNAKK